MNSLVTGGAGFIGSNLVDALVARGDTVTVLDNVSTGRKENLAQAIENGARLTEVDVRDADAVSQAVGEAKPDAHLPPGRPGSTYANRWPTRRRRSLNVDGTINVLPVGAGAGVQKSGQHLDRRRDLRRDQHVPTPDTSGPTRGRPTA